MLKKILKWVFVSFFVAAIGFAGKFIYDLNLQIASLSSKLVNLNKENKKLNDKNKVLAKNLKDEKNRKLKNKKKLKDYRNRLSARKLDKGTKKISKAGLAMVPFAGSAVIISMTAYELSQYCKEVDEFAELEESITGENSERTEDEKLLCLEYNYDSVVEKLQQQATISKKSANGWLREKYSVTEEWIINQSDALMKKYHSIAD